VLVHKNFDGFIIGAGALYTDFFDARADDFNSLSASRHKKVSQYFNNQVFGSDLEDGRKETERQAVFNRAKQKELARLAQKESNGDGNGSDEEDEEKKDGGSGNKGSQDGSQGE
jgi:hypothetical protein